MQDHPLIPEQLVDRQVAAVRRGVDGLTTIVEGQRAVLEVAAQLPLLWVEALTHVSRALLATTMELTDRLVTTSTESIDRFSESLIVVGDDTARTRSSAHKASAAAA